MREGNSGRKKRGTEQHFSVSVPKEQKMYSTLVSNIELKRGEMCVYVFVVAGDKKGKERMEGKLREVG